MSVAGEQRKPARSKGIPLIAFVLGALLVGAAAGYFGGKSLKQSGVKLDAWILAALPVAFWLVIAWHEFGHLLGGWSAGFRFALFAAGPLRIDRVHGRVRVRWNRSAALWGGVAATAPPGVGMETAEHMRRAMMRVVAGGPLLSLAGAVLLVPGSILMPSDPSLAVLLNITGALSLMVGLGTLIPNSMAGFQSDGARLLQLWRGGEEAERWACLALLSGFSASRRPRNWPEELVISGSRGALESNDGVSGAWLRATWHEDRGELPEASEWISRALAAGEFWPKPARPLLHATAAYVRARVGDATAAREHLDQAAAPGFLEKEQRLLAEAAVLLAEGNAAGARAIAGKALQEIPESGGEAVVAVREKLLRLSTEAAA